MCEDSLKSLISVMSLKNEVGLMQKRLMNKQVVARRISCMSQRQQMQN